MGGVNYNGRNAWDQNISFDNLIFMAYGVCEEDAQALVNKCECSDQDSNPFDKVLNNLNLIGKYRHFFQRGGGEIDKLWTFLDSQSTVDVICNPKMLKYIKKIDVHLCIHSTGGVAKTNRIGLLPGYG